MYFCISLSMLAFVSLALLARCSPLVAGLPVCSLLTVSEVSEVLTARSRRAIVAAGLAAVEGATTAAAAREPLPARLVLLLSRELLVHLSSGTVIVMEALLLCALPSITSAWTFREFMHGDWDLEGARGGVPHSCFWTCVDE